MTLEDIFFKITIIIIFLCVLSGALMVPVYLFLQIKEMRHKRVLNRDEHLGKSLSYYLEIIKKMNEDGKCGARFDCSDIMKIIEYIELLEEK